MSRGIGASNRLTDTSRPRRSEPAPPNPHLARYYEALEATHGFERTWIRTDYEFASCDEAVELCGMFFGPELADTVARDRSTRVPECTGVWWRRRM